MAEHDIGPNLLNELMSLLRINNISCTKIDRNILLVNNKKLFVLYSNASKVAPSRFFWGISQRNMERHSEAYNVDYFILLGGRNVGLKAKNKILMICNDDEKKIINSIRIENLYFFNPVALKEIVHDMEVIEDNEDKGGKQWKVDIDIQLKKGMIFRGLRESKIVSYQKLIRDHLNKTEYIIDDIKTSNNIKYYLNKNIDNYDSYRHIIEKYYSYQNISIPKKVDYKDNNHIKDDYLINNNTQINNENKKESYPIIIQFTKECMLIRTKIDIPFKEEKYHEEILSYNDLGKYKNIFLKIHEIESNIDEGILKSINLNFKNKDHISFNKNFYKENRFIMEFIRDAVIIKKRMKLPFINEKEYKEILSYKELLKYQDVELLIDHIQPIIDNMVLKSIIFHITDYTIINHE